MKYVDRLLDHWRGVPAPPEGIWFRARRFLRFGDERGLAVRARGVYPAEAHESLRAVLAAHGPQVVNQLTEHPGAETALFALALAASPRYADARTNSLALQALPLVARAGRDLLRFAAFASRTRGWGRALRSAVAAWYRHQPPAAVAREVMRRPASLGWSHRDLVRLAHPKPETPEQQALFRWIASGELASAAENLTQLYAFTLARQSTEEAEIVRLVEDYGLTYDMLPVRWHRSPRVWEALLGALPYAALLGRLGKLTALGVLRPTGPETALAASRLADVRRLERSGVSPVTLAASLDAYRHGARWQPVPALLDALHAALEASFGMVPASGRRSLVALDVTPGALTGFAGRRAAALALSVLRAEQHAYAFGYARGIAPLALHRLELVTQPGPADPGAVFAAALDDNLAIEAFTIVTNHGDDPRLDAALRLYRERSGIAARLAVVSPAGRVGAAPADPLRLHVAGLDGRTPALLAAFFAE